MNALARCSLSLSAPGRRDARGHLAQDRPRAPVMVATMASYLDQLEVSARPGTVAAAELTLRSSPIG